MVRVRYDRTKTDYQTFFRNWPWHDSGLERPRLMAAAIVLAHGEPDTVLDPACGDGWTVEVANRIRPIKQAYLSDVSPGVVAQLWGHDFGVRTSLELRDLFVALDGPDKVDAVVLTEVLEHLEDPDRALRMAHNKARWLVASSPLLPEGVEDHTNEHLWSWDEQGYGDMLVQTGWTPQMTLLLHVKDHPYPTFQVWGCSA